MGNQPSKKLHFEEHTEPHMQGFVEETVKETTPERKWMESDKTIEDLKQLMRQDSQWPQILRGFLRKITSKQEYQRYLRAILQEILEKICNIGNENYQEKNEQMNKNLENEEQEIIKEKSLLVKQSSTKPINRNELLEQFTFYKTRLQQSYFVITHEKGGIKEHTGESEFQASLQQLQSSSSSSSFTQSHFTAMIPELMLSQLYQYSSVKQNYMSELFMELNIKVYEALQEFTHLLIEEFILVEDQFNLAKFVVEYEVMMSSLEYLETCTKLMEKSERAQVFEKIKKFKQQPTLPYLQMCRIFLKYKNVQAAQLIIHTLIQKGYHLNEKQLTFYFCVELFNVFLYGINYSQAQYQNYLKQKHEHLSESSDGSFMSFGEKFQSLDVEDVFGMFLAVRSYNQINLIKKCYETALSLYEPKRGEKMLLKHLKKYALSDKAHFIITIQALKNHLSYLEEQQREDIEILFLHKLSLQMNTDIIDYQRHVIELLKIYNFSKQGYEFVKIIFKVSSILSKFQISLKVSELCQFLFYNRKLSTFLKFKPKILPSPTCEASIQQLQFQALIIIKKVITKYFTLSQSRQQVVFIIEDKFDQEYFEYSTKQIESLFIMTEYLHTNLLQAFVPLQQLHQLLFQHMMHFSKYEDVETMLKEENLSRYFIQREVVKMLILENVREMLVKSEKEISLISQDVKKQLKIVQALLTEQSKARPNKLLQFDHDQNIQSSQKSLPDTLQLQQLQSIRSLLRLLIKLDYYSISLNQQQKENINISLLYFLIQHYEHQIEVFDYDELYRLIVLVQGKWSTEGSMKNGIQGGQIGASSPLSSPDAFSNGETPVTNQYLKFKIDLAHLAYERGRIKFGQQVLKQVLLYQPPWISSQIIKIIRKSPHSAAINHSFLNIAFQYCVKGQDLVFLLQVWKQKTNQKQKKTGQKLTELFETTKKYIVIDDSYVKDEKQYRNLVAEMTFNDETLKSKDYELFFTLLGTEPERAFYMIYSKGLDIVKIEIILKQGMKMGIFNSINVTKIFFKLLYFIVSSSKKRDQSNNHLFNRVSFIKFKNNIIEQIVEKTEKEKLLQTSERSKPYQKEIPFIFLKKIYKPIKSLLLLPPQFIQNYLENPSHIVHQNTDGQFLHMFLYDENYREKHLIGLKDQPMGKNDIRLYRQLCFINNLNILDLILFNLTNQLNTTEIYAAERLLEQEKMQNVLQKIVTWTENDSQLLQDILSKLTTQLFSSKMLYNILSYLRQKQNPLIRQIVSQEHMQILQSLTQIQVNTQFHGLITQQFFQKPILYNPKQKLSEKHLKILKKELKLRNVFLISKVMYFCYGMSSEVEKQVLKIFIKQNQNQHEKQIFQQIKAKLHEAEN